MYYRAPDGVNGWSRSLVGQVTPVDMVDDEPVATAIEVRPPTVFEDVAVVVGPKRPDV